MSRGNLNIKRLGLILIIGMILILAVTITRSYQARPINDYRFHTPPPGPNARPDPHVIKHLPGPFSGSK